MNNEPTNSKEVIILELLCLLIFSHLLVRLMFSPVSYKIFLTSVFRLFSNVNDS